MATGAIKDSFSLLLLLVSLLLIEPSTGQVLNPPSFNLAEGRKVRKKNLFKLNQIKLTFVSLFRLTPLQHAVWALMVKNIIVNLSVPSGQLMTMLTSKYFRVKLVIIAIQMTLIDHTKLNLL